MGASCCRPKVSDAVSPTKNAPNHVHVDANVHKESTYPGTEEKAGLKFFSSRNKVYPEPLPLKSQGQSRSDDDLPLPSPILLINPPSPQANNATTALAPPMLQPLNIQVEDTRVARRSEEKARSEDHDMHAYIIAATPSGVLIDASTPAVGALPRHMDDDRTIPSSSSSTRPGHGEQEHMHTAQNAEKHKLNEAQAAVDSNAAGNQSHRDDNSIQEYMQSSPRDRPSSVTEAVQGSASQTHSPRRDSDSRINNVISTHHTHMQHPNALNTSIPDSPNHPDNSQSPTFHANSNASPASQAPKSSIEDTRHMQGSAPHSPDTHEQNTATSHTAQHDSTLDNSSSKTAEGNSESEHQTMSIHAAGDDQVHAHQPQPSGTQHSDTDTEEKNMLAATAAGAHHVHEKDGKNELSQTPRDKCAHDSQTAATGAHHNTSPRQSTELSATMQQQVQQSPSTETTSSTAEHESLQAGDGTCPTATKEGSPTDPMQTAIPIHKTASTHSVRANSHGDLKNKILAQMMEDGHAAAQSEAVIELVCMCFLCDVLSGLVCVFMYVCMYIYIYIYIYIYT
jgi:hypothetical protein